MLTVIKIVAMLVVCYFIGKAYGYLIVTIVCNYLDKKEAKIHE